MSIFFVLLVNSPDSSDKGKNKKYNKIENYYARAGRNIYIIGKYKPRYEAKHRNSRRTDCYASEAPADTHRGKRGENHKT